MYFKNRKITQLERQVESLNRDIKRLEYVVKQQQQVVLGNRHGDFEPYLAYDTWREGEIKMPVEQVIKELIKHCGLEVQQIEASTQLVKTKKVKKQ